MSAICQNFVQNAWKKELCSNCFKSKDDHVKRSILPIVLSKKSVESIIRNANKFKPKRRVGFPEKLIEIIGEGGDDWDGEDEEETTEDEGEDVTDSEDDELEMCQVTKENTAFNTVSLSEPEVKTTFTPLNLGKPILDENGKKKTLLVQVTPFGEENGYKKISGKTDPDALIETKTSIILSSAANNNNNNINKSKDRNKEEKSLLDEITETLEKGKNPIQIMVKKRTEKEITLEAPLIDSNKENLVQEISVENEKIKESSPVRNKITLTRTPALKRDTEKPVYQTSTAKIELLNNNTNNINKNLINKRLENSSCSNSKSDRSSEDILNSNNATGENSLQPTQPVSNNDHQEQDQDYTNDAAESKHKKNKINTTVAEHTVNLRAALPPLPKYPQTREQAGEPDGRADPESPDEPPSLPLTPPPLFESQNSFLHNTINKNNNEKPKIPLKPTIPFKQNRDQKSTLSTFNSSSDRASINSEPGLIKIDNDPEVDGEVEKAEIICVVNKRKAPKPPECFNSYLNPEREKFDRASSCSPKLPLIQIKQQEHQEVPLAPRKMLSLSSDNLVMDNKKKDKSKNRFSLKKFLKMGSNKDLTKTPSEIPRLEPDDHSRPRLVIVHPCDLSGDSIQVLAKPPEMCNKNINESVLSSNKPPPPPRNSDKSKTPAKPALPPSSKLVTTKPPMPRLPENKKEESVYANIGEVRSAIVPSKPQRTASMREKEAKQKQQQQQQQHQHQRNISDCYEPIEIRDKEMSCENVYDCISIRSSSPDSDISGKIGAKRQTSELNRSESSIDISEDFHHNFKSISDVSRSFPYCGSETESEIYTPYSFCGSESEVMEDDHDWLQNGRTHKLRSRKGRSIVHKKLEDNYGAVIVANHEALAHVLENIHQTVQVTPHLRGLKTLPNLRWNDFTVTSTPIITLGPRVFYQALWGSHHVTLIISSGSLLSSTLSLGTFSLVPVTEFNDLIPRDFISSSTSDDSLVQATVSVLPSMQVHSVQSYCELLSKNKGSQIIEDSWRDSSFMLLQFVNALKTLQAQGIEELALSLNSFVLCKEIEKDSHHRLYVLHGLGEKLSHNQTEEKYGTLCLCALKVLTMLQPASKISLLMHSILCNERAISLSLVKSILEFSLWGPTDVPLGCTVQDRELAIQRWLDLQRATVLHGLVCTRVQLTVQEEYHLLFFVRTNAKMMCEASMLLESSNNGGRRSNNILPIKVK